MRAAIALALPALGALGLIALGPPPRDARDDKDAYSRMVETHFLSAAAPRLRTVANRAPGQPPIELDPAAERDADAMAFVRASELQTDLRSLDPDIWRIENGRVTGIKANRHVDADPLRRRGGWNGALLYRAGGSRPPERPLALIDESGATLALIARAVAARATGETVAIDPWRPREGPERGERIEIVCGGDPVAVVVRVGDQLAAFAPPETRAGGCHAEIADRPLTPGRAVAMTPGRALRVIDQRRGGERRLQGETIDAQPPLSSPSPTGRQHDAAAMPWARAAADDLESAGNAGGALRATLDAAVQRDARATLDTATLAERPAKGRPVVAAAVVMDALTGEIVALASVEKRIDGEAAGAIDPALRKLPIGSAAKPILAAAILADQPRLAGMRMAGLPKDSRELLGLGFPAGGKVPGAGVAATIDFATFIRLSDNGYAAALLLLASADSRPNICVAVPAGARFSIAVPGNACEVAGGRIKSVFEARTRAGGYRYATSAGQSLGGWVDKLDAIFELNARRPGRGTRLAFSGCDANDQRYGDDERDASPWRAAIGASGGACAFTRSVPERAALGLVGRLDFTTQAMQTMLGGGEDGCRR